MNKFILLTILFCATNVFAQAKIASEKVGDADLGEIQVVVSEYGEPVYNPLQMKITVLCKDNRLSKTAAVPKWSNAAIPQAICAFGGQTYDSTSKNLVIKFTEAAMVVGDAPCEDARVQTIDIKKICARWNK